MWDKVPPHNIDAEQAVLGAILLDNLVVPKVVRHIRAEDFYMQSHRVIFEVILELDEGGQAADLVTVTESLRRKGELEKVGGISYVATLANIAPTAANAEYYAHIVEEKALLRNLINLATRIAGMGYEGGEDAERLMEEAERMLMELGSRRTSTIFTEIKDILKDAFKHLEYLYKNKGEITGVPTGYTDLDRICQGFQPSDLIIVAARPSMGKTSFGLCVAYQAAVQTSKPVAVFSLEMSKEQLVQRMLCAEAKVDHHKLRRGEMGEEDWVKLANQAREMARLPIFIDDSGMLTARQVRAKSRQIHMEKGLGLIVIDYLQLMHGGRRTENRQQEIAEISRSLKSLAKELNVPVVALAQLSRSVEQRQDKRPQLSDLRESGCLAGDSLVQMSNGQRIPIKFLSDVNDTSQIMALNETTWKLEPAKISKAWCTGTKQVFRLATQSGKEIKATANHKFRTVEGWKRLDQLKAGDHLALPRSWEGLLKKATMTEGEVSLLGHLIGDGCTLPRHAVQYTSNEIELAKTVADLAIEVFGELVKPRIVRQNTWWQVYLTSASHLTHGTRNPVAKWLESLGVWGYRSHEKRVPQKVFQQPVETINKFIRHLWVTDGTLGVVGRKKPRPVIYYATSSKMMAYDIQHLLLHCGIISVIHRVPQRGKGLDQWHVVVTGKPNIIKFVNEIGSIGVKTKRIKPILDFYQSREHIPNNDVIPATVWRTLVDPARRVIGLSQRGMQSMLGVSYCGSTLYKHNLSRKRAATVAQVVQNEFLTRLSNSDVFWDRIASIEPEGMERVYDLEIPGYHNFIADDVVVHNSLEQDADVVMFIYRDEYYNPDTEKTSIADIIVAKQRNGPTGTVELGFIKEFTRFVNLARRGEREQVPE
ncbi:MAG: replicative DNA helicase [Desulfotomaculaceae bacterium]